MTGTTIAVLGGGNGGHMTAADMKLKGHTVRFYEMPAFRHNLEQVFKTRTIDVSGTIRETVVLDMVTDDIDAAISGAEYILITTPAFAHEGYAKLLKGRVGKDQVIVVFPGAFAALVFRNIFGADECPVIADVNNLPYDTRIMAPGKIDLFGRNKVNIAFLPAAAGAGLVEKMRKDLFPFEKVYEDVLECGLSIVNPALHSGPCLFNISAIERPDVRFFLYEHGFTPSAAKMDIALDNERKAIGRKLGYTLTPIEDFSGLKEGYTWRELYQATHGSIALTPICGPNDVNNRYLTEDAPFGLVPWSGIAKLVGVGTPLIDAVVNIYNVIHETDWWQRGNTVAKFGLEGMNPQQISSFVKTGKK